MTLPASFWSKTATETGCVIWQGAQNSKGYGCYAIDGVSRLAHRVVWESLHGPIPDGLTIDHLCRVRACVNVAHMELVSVAENTARKPRVLLVGGTCRHGHALPDEAAIYVNARGRAECRQCRRNQARTRAEIERVKAGAAA